MFLFLTACSENALVSKEDPPTGDTGSGAPAIAVDPASVDFGVVAYGGEATATVTLSNVGTAPLHLASLSLRNDTADVSWTALSSPVVPVGDSVDTVLTWAPVGGSALDDVLLVDSDDPDDAEVGVPLGGTVPAGDILVEPATYDFGTLTVGGSATTVVTVSNVGDGVLTIDDWSYSATDSDLHVLDAGGLTALPATLAPGDSTDMVVEYVPSAAGGDEGSLAISSDDPDTPSTGAQQYGNGDVDDPCEGFTQTVDLFLTADDAWQGWLDGTEFSGPNSATWSAFDSFEWELSCGDHALSLYATDTGLVISGVIAVVSVEGSVRFVSGPSNWTMLDTLPPAGWTDPSFDDSAWHIPEVCTDTTPWGSTPQPFYDLGAQWIWWSSDCHNLGQAWLRLNFTVP